MNYQQNHGRFTDDWSICVVKAGAEEEEGGKKNTDRLVRNGNSAQLELLELFQEVSWGFTVGMDRTFLAD